jgi:hypothetical protein
MYTADAEYSLGAEEQAAKAAEAMMAGRCLIFTRKDGSGETVSFYPLSPLYFATRWYKDECKVERKVIEKPFAYHFNWLIGTKDKIKFINNSGLWLAG